MSSGADWIEWTGGEESPVAPGVTHERKYRDGSIGYFKQAAAISWVHTGTRHDIIAYRPYRVVSA